MIRFAQPWWLLLFLVLLGACFYYVRYYRRPVIRFSKTASLKQVRSGKGVFWTRFLLGLRLALLSLIIVTLAQPQQMDVKRQYDSEGIDILLALDVSGSMAAEDFKPDNRLAVAKEEIRSFVQKRVSDRLGLVVFGTDAFTRCPLTTDYDVLLHFLSGVELGMAGQETAIGMALATGLNRLKRSNQASKIIILLTDGENNQGQIDPITAAGLCQELGVKVYTIGIGKQGGAPVPYMDPVYGKQYYSDQFGRPLLTTLDETLLREIAELTGGRYFRAFDAKGLADTYRQIDALEKTEISADVYYQYYDFFPVLLLVVLALFLLDLLLSHLFFIRVP